MPNSAYSLSKFNVYDKFLSLKGYNMRLMNIKMIVFFIFSIGLSINAYGGTSEVDKVKKEIEVAQNQYNLEKKNGNKNIDLLIKSRNDLVDANYDLREEAERLKSINVGGQYTSQIKSMINQYNKRFDDIKKLEKTIQTAIEAYNKRIQFLNKKHNKLVDKLKLAEKKEKMRQRLSERTIKEFSKLKWHLKNQEQGELIASIILSLEPFRALVTSDPADAAAQAYLLVKSDVGWEHLKTALKGIKVSSRISAKKWAQAEALTQNSSPNDRRFWLKLSKAFGS